MTHDLPWMIRGTNCDKQIQSSIQIHKFKLELGFLLTVLNLLSYFLLDPIAIFLQWTEFLSLLELPLFRLFDSGCFQPSPHQPTACCPSIRPVARLSYFIGPWSTCSQHNPSQSMHRPVEGNARVRPDALQSYRKTHQFLGPCCLCPLLTPLSGEPQFTEAAMYVPIFGRYAGEYVAECAKSRCGYLG